MNIHRTLLIAVIIGVSSAVYGQTGGQDTHYSLYGLQFISRSQSLRLTAQNPRYSNSEIVPCVRVSIVLDFYEAAGDGSVRPQLTRRLSRQVDLDPGQAASFEIPATLICDGSVCPAARDGVYVAASVFMTPIDAPERFQLRSNSTLVVREFNRTVFTLPVVEKGFDPQPEPPVFHSTTERP